MKGLSLLLITSLMVITGSCNMFSEEQLDLEQDVMQIIFFSNESDYAGEASYYDALIELKKDYPAEIKNMLVFTPSEGKQYYNAFDIKSCPALLVIFNNEVMVRINGQKTKENIIQPITKALVKDLNASS